MARNPQGSLSAVLSLLAVVLLLAGCPPKYPKCDNDDHCKKGEFCVKGQCQQCRDSKDCKKGEFCKGGRCEADKDHCETSEDCPNGGACKNNRCVPCKVDGDCGPGAKCKNGKCLRPGQCLTDADCPENHECQNGKCVAPPNSGGGQAKCTPEPVYFDFDEFVLTSDASNRLQAAASCIKSVPRRPIRLEGHCDPRGTDEYNLALGDRRSQAVKRYLERIGIEDKRMRAVSKGKLEATGTSEVGWSKDRKVQFIWE
jgi:peptidoglycan-associated lipoprotein